jgi:hypothetical protein
MITIVVGILNLGPKRHTFLLPCFASYSTLTEGRRVLELMVGTLPTERAPPLIQRKTLYTEFQIITLIK